MGDTIQDTECRLTIGDVHGSLRFKGPAYSFYLMRGTLRENVKMHDTRCTLNRYQASSSCTAFDNDLYKTLSYVTSHRSFHVHPIG